MTAVPTPLVDTFTAVPVPATPLPGQWSFWVDRTVDKSIIGAVQPTAFNYTSLLNAFGSGSVSLPVDGSPFEVDDLILFWSWRLWAFYAGTPVWCGCPTGVVDTGGATVDLTLTELSGYLGQRQFDATRNWVPPAYPNGIEQTEIARQIAAVVADAGVTVAVSPGPGFLRQRQYAYLEGESRAELLTNLANVISGPEFRTEYAMSAGRPTATLRIAYPRVGSAATDLGLTVPGDAVGDFSATWDADQFRTRTFAVGDLPADAPEGAAQPVVIVDRPQPGVPRLDRADTWEGVVVPATLNERANTNATLYATPVLEVEGSVFESLPPLGTYAVGDSVTVNLRTVLIPEGLVTSARLAGIDVNATSGTVKWTLALTQPPSKPRPSLSARLAGHDASITQMFKRNLVEPT